MNTTQSKSFLIAKDIPVQDVDKGITRQFLGYNKDVMMVRMTFDKGAIGYEHSHPHVQTSYIISGKFEVTIDNKTSVLTTGDGFFVESNIIHGLVCIESGELIDVFCPMREDLHADMPK